MKVINVEANTDYYQIELHREDIGLLAHGLHELVTTTADKHRISDNKVKSAKLLRAGLLEILRRYEV